MKQEYKKFFQNMEERYQKLEERTGKLDVKTKAEMDEANL